VEQSMGIIKPEVPTQQARKFKQGLRYGESRAKKYKGVLSSFLTKIGVDRWRMGND